MSEYRAMEDAQLIELKAKLEKEYEAFKQKGLQLNMARGKPSKDQLDLSMEMLDCVTARDAMVWEDKLDLRNYGALDGIVEAKRLFAGLLGVSVDEVIVGGNSSLNMMYDTVARCLTHGVDGRQLPWNRQGEVKFLCPTPGYDRHFAICEHFGIKMINVPMRADGPDMEMIEKLVSKDAAIKGIWCVPKYSNPDGVTYSDEVVRRFASLRPAAGDFRIFWDNAYCVHDFTDQPDTLLNIMDECKKRGREDMFYEFASTSKISFSGSGVAAMAASRKNLAFIKKLLSIQTIGPDKLNQLRHVKFFGDADGVRAHMKKHAAILKPKFDCVLRWLDKEIRPCGIGSWQEPHGGYFVSFHTLEGCAKRVVFLCKEAGVVLTGAGATYPYGIDPLDANIRIAPTFPPVGELEVAMELFCLCVKLASVEKILADRV